MSTWVFDLEADNLLKSVTTMWCGVFQNVETNEVKKFTPNFIQDMLSFMDTCDTLVGHNVLGFDFPALEKLFGYKYKGTIIDTLVLSFLDNADRHLGHSVEAWAKHLNLEQQKVEHEDWSKFTPEMLHRCTTDVVIQVEIYKYLSKRLVADPRYNVDWELPIAIENELTSIVTMQEYHGVPFNLDLAKTREKQLAEMLEEIKNDVHTALGSRCVQVGKHPIKTIFKLDGSYRAHVTDWFSDADISNTNIHGTYSKVKFEQIELSQYDAVKKRLIDFGWTPTKFTEKGSPKMPKLEELEDLANASGHTGLASMAKFGSISNRYNIITKWIETAENNQGKLPAGAFPNGTNTGRFKHFTVVNVPRASTKDGDLIYYPEPQGSFFGTEMRELFYSDDPDYLFVGADAAGLELRCLAHYLNNPEFTETLLKADIHTMLWEAAGGETWIASRNDDKSVTYAWLYGAGDIKIASLCTSKKGKPKAIWGKTVRQNLLKNIKGLGGLVDAVTTASRRGFLRGIDGRKVFMRTSNGRVQEHKSLNTLLQSTGSILVKYWTILVNRQVKELGLDAQQVIHMHDEMQWICHKNDTDKLSDILKQAMVDTGKFFNLNLPLAADVQIGNNWAETH